MNSDQLPVYSDIEQIQSLLAEKTTDINRAGIFLRLKQQVAYGTQLFCEGQGSEGIITIYYSKKKGFSFVPKTPNPATDRVIGLLSAESGNANDIDEVDIREKKLNAWIGTDESGKGDFFGPLVIAGFFITRPIEKELLKLGVTDSKKLSSRQIHSIADQLQQRYHDHIEVVAPSNEKYNELYNSFRNLNDLLAWGHARVIDNLFKRWHVGKKVAVDGVVSDQFGKDNAIRNALSAMKELNLIQRHRGESNTAVAAASIVARSVFEKKIGYLSRQYSQAFPFGAGPQVIDAAKQFTKRYQKDSLYKVAKTHFKTFQQIH